MNSTLNPHLFSVKNGRSKFTVYRSYHRKIFSCRIKRRWTTNISEKFIFTVRVLEQFVDPSTARLDFSIDATEVEKLMKGTSKSCESDLFSHLPEGCRYQLTLSEKDEDRYLLSINGGKSYFKISIAKEAFRKLTSYKKN